MMCDRDVVDELHQALELSQRYTRDEHSAFVTKYLHHLQSLSIDIRCAVLKLLRVNDEFAKLMVTVVSDDWSHRVQLLALQIITSYLNTSPTMSFPPLLLDLFQQMHCREVMDLRLGIIHAMAASRSGVDLSVFMTLCDRSMLEDEPVLKVAMLRAMVTQRIESLRWETFYEMLVKSTALPASLRRRKRRRKPDMSLAKFIVRGTYVYAAEDESTEVRVAVAECLITIFNAYATEKAVHNDKDENNSNNHEEDDAVLWRQACEEAVLAIYLDLLLDFEPRVILASLRQILASAVIDRSKVAMAFRTLSSHELVALIQQTRLMPGEYTRLLRQLFEAPKAVKEEDEQLVRRSWKQVAGGQNDDVAQKAFQREEKEEAKESEGRLEIVRVEEVEEGKRWSVEGALEDARVEEMHAIVLEVEDGRSLTVEWKEQIAGRKRGKIRMWKMVEGRDVRTSWPRVRFVIQPNGDSTAWRQLTRDQIGS